MLPGGNLLVKLACNSRQERLRQALTANADSCCIAVLLQTGVNKRFACCRVAANFSLNNP